MSCLSQEPEAADCHVSIRNHSQTDKTQLERESGLFKASCHLQQRPCLLVCQLQLPLWRDMIEACVACLRSWWGLKQRFVAIWLVNKWFQVTACPFPWRMGVIISLKRTRPTPLGWGVGVESSMPAALTVLVSPLWSFGPIHRGAKQMEPVDVNRSVHTARKQHQRICIGICGARPVWIAPYMSGSVEPRSRIHFTLDMDPPPIGIVWRVLISWCSHHDMA